MKGENIMINSISQNQSFGRCSRCPICGGKDEKLQNKDEQGMRESSDTVERESSEDSSSYGRYSSPYAKQREEEEPWERLDRYYGGVCRDLPLFW